MVKAERLAIRITKELKERLAGLAQENHSDSLSLEARRILEKSLGIKRTRREVAR
jgi:predicted DNA-binding protein